MERKGLFVVTGATGFIGVQLVPLLAEQSNVLLVSRDPIEAGRLFPDAQIVTYAELPNQDLAASTFIHLAVRNNDRPGTSQDFQTANVKFLMEIAAIAKNGGAARFINLCSTHALAPDRDDPYSRSKQEGAARLRSFWPEGAINLYVPSVYGAHFGGQLRILNRLPVSGRRLVLSVLRLAKPVLSIDRLLNKLLMIPEIADDRRGDDFRSEIYLADPIPAFGFYAGAKRAIDMLAAIAVIALAGWAMVLIALYIRIDSKGPAIFAQKRVGQNARTFTCFKFRTMTIGTADAATHDVSIHSLTKAGRFLRKTKLDELPQVVNILRNEMSLVGPRPCLPIQQNLIDRRAARDVFTLKPGITGLAQIRDVDMSNPTRLAALDDQYRAFRTLLDDGIICLRTVLGGGSGDRVRIKDHG